MRENQKRVQKTSVLLFGEGAEDRAVLAHFCNVFANRLTHHIKSDSGFGGSPHDVLTAAGKHSGHDFDRKLLILDGDRHKSEYTSVHRVAGTQGFEVVVLSPCMEAFLLSIITPLKKWHTKGSDYCKRYFEKQYIQSKHRTLPAAYATHLTEEKIKKACVKLPEIKMIINAIQK